MHSVVIHTWHVLHALWSVGSMNIHSRAIRTCTPESYIHTLWTLGSCVPAIQGHTCMPSEVVHTCPLESGVICTCHPGPYVHAIQSHTYMLSGAILTCPPRSYIHTLQSLMHPRFRHSGKKRTPCTTKIHCTMR